MESRDNKMNVLLNKNRLNQLRDKLADAGSDIARIGEIIRQIRQIDPMFNRNRVVDETESSSTARLRDELANAGSDIARIGSIIQQIRQIDPMFNRNWVVGETDSDSDSDED